MEQQMNQTNQANQNIMAQPPTMVSTKDLLYLTDMLSWNLVAIKKSHFFEQHCQNQEIKQAVEQVCQLHEKHYDVILNYAQQHANQTYH
ncbi:hypothetical protein [Amphibacillus sediminis]|uniref:hypothetical protein n=1 Tax=Amphibacillus sediminis TaxID=360185 RepID=UPI0008300B59|nr:hypothetical protein [Amphibacillus sediminis]